jgi:H+/Na+-translocating ferredoxin:NAD+ oxidoreductase subunit C
MIQRSFFGWSKPRIFTQRIQGPAVQPEEMPLPGKVYLRVEKRNDGLAALVQVGDAVRTGERLQVTETAETAVTATVTGTVTGIETAPGDFGRKYWAVEIEATAEEATDRQFETAATDPSMTTLTAFLTTVPGAPPLAALSDPDRPITTIVVSGVDQDVLSMTRQYVAGNRAGEIQHGMDILKAASGAENLVFALPADVIQNVGHIHATPVGVATEFPATLPKMIMRDVLGQTVPADKSCEDLGTCFVSVEAVAAIGRAFSEKRVPVNKLVTVADKAGGIRLIRARIGTPIEAIFAELGIAINDMDRIVVGGPLTGAAIFNTGHPILADTDMIMIQDGADLAQPSDYPCINCGDCIPICPTCVPVNMLVRFLEAGQYETAADEYDLHACVECGLCAFVCVSKIPILQYIRLGKYELARTQQAEAANA